MHNVGNQIAALLDEKFWVNLSIYPPSQTTGVYLHGEKKISAVIFSTKQNHFVYFTIFFHLW